MVTLVPSSLVRSLTGNLFDPSVEFRGCSLVGRDLDEESRRVSSIGSRGRWAECLIDLEVPLMSLAVSLTDPVVCQIDPELPAGWPGC